MITINSQPLLLHTDKDLQNNKVSRNSNNKKWFWCERTNDIEISYDIMSYDLEYKVNTLMLKEVKLLKESVKLNRREGIF